MVNIDKGVYQMRPGEAIKFMWEEGDVSNTLEMVLRGFETTDESTRAHFDFRHLQHRGDSEIYRGEAQHATIKPSAKDWYAIDDGHEFEINVRRFNYENALRISVQTSSVRYRHSEHPGFEDFPCNVSVRIEYRKASVSR